MKCECGSVKIDRKCPTCHPLRKHSRREGRLRKVLEKRDRKVGAYCELLTFEEVNAGAARAMNRRRK
jgi:hypothetical protein